MEGTIDRLVVDKGYGFIRSDEHQQGRDRRGIFFHVRDLRPPLEFDEALRERRVSFDIEETDKGTAARNIRPRD